MLVQHYNQAFRPEHGRVTVLGDVTAQSITPKLDTLLAAWKGAGTAPPTLALPAVTRGKRIILVNRPNSVQTAFYVGNHAIDRLSPDYIPVQVLNRILGGGPSSRLFRNIREEKGYTYGISSGFSASRYMNHFASQTSVRTEVTADALRELLKEFADIRNRPVPADELENAKRALVASFALNTENAGSALSLATQVKEYGFPADYWDTYPQKIAAVTAADVQRVAQKYIPARRHRDRRRRRRHEDQERTERVRNDRRMGLGGETGRYELRAGQRRLPTSFACPTPNSQIHSSERLGVGQASVVGNWELALRAAGRVLPGTRRRRST